MIVTCPKDKNHNKFETVTHVTEDWVIDEKGNFLSVSKNSEANVVVGPTIGNTSTCHVCGAEAHAE